MRRNDVTTLDDWRLKRREGSRSERYEEINKEEIRAARQRNGKYHWGTQSRFSSLQSHYTRIGKKLIRSAIGIGNGAY